MKACQHCIRSQQSSPALRCPAVFRSRHSPLRWWIGDSGLISSTGNPLCLPLWKLLPLTRHGNRDFLEPPASCSALAKPGMTSSDEKYLPMPCQAVVLDLTRQWAIATNMQAPDRVIYFRDGVDDGAFAAVLKVEWTALQEVRALSFPYVSRPERNSPRI